MTPTTANQLLGDGTRSDSRWWLRAACRDVDVNLFFKPDKHDTVSRAEKTRRVNQAKALCRRCPITAECLDEAIALRDRYAIRAAYTPDERAAQTGTS